jgi:hypothetical protein
MDKTYSAIEQEVIILRASWSMMDEIANLEMFQRHPPPAGSHVVFKTKTHCRMFNVLLGDFLSQPIDGAFNLRANQAKDKTYRDWISMSSWSGS